MGVTCGYWAIGSLIIAIRPVIVMTSAITAEKIGRSIKKWESMNHLSLFLSRGRRGLSVAGGRLCCRIDDLYRRPGRKLHNSVGDHRVAFDEAAGNKPVSTIPRSHLHRANLCLTVLIDNHDKVTLGPLQHSLLRHENRVRPRCT